MLNITLVNKQSNWKPLPKPLKDPELGLASFIMLEYNSFPDERLEHCVLMIPKHWDTMYELIRAPGEFVEFWRKVYKDTPYHAHGGPNRKEWEFTEPITIVIEPLTAATAANKVLLLGLSTLWPGLANAMDPSLTVEEFAIAVKEGAKVSPTTTWSNKVPNVADVPVELWEKGHGGKLVKKVKKVPLVGNEAMPKTYPSPLPGGFIPAGPSYPGGPPVGTAPFPLQFVAEFALKTRTLYIRYIPHDTTPVGTFSWAANRDELTTMTVDPVQGTRISYLHVDIAFDPATITHEIVAESRARFAMNFITDLTFMNEPGLIRVKQKSGPHAPEGFMSTAPLIYAVNTVALPDPTSDPITRPVIAPLATTSDGKPTPASAPMVILDSVWPDPAKKKYTAKDISAMRNTATPPSGNPPPTNPTEENPTPLCLVLVTTPVVVNGVVTYVTSQVIVKSYAPEEDPPFGGRVYKGTRGGSKKDIPSKEGKLEKKKKI